MPSSATQLGRVIANVANQSNDIREDALPDDVDQNLLLAPSDSLVITTVVTGTASIYPTTSFILDHAVYGDLDSSTLQLDGGYDSTGTFKFSYSS